MEVLPNSATAPPSNHILQSLFTLEKERDVLKAQCISLRNKLKTANNLLIKLKQDPSNKKLEETQKELRDYTKKCKNEIQTLTKELETTRNEHIKLKKQINTNNDRSGTQICDEHENKILELEVEVKEWKKKHTDLQQRGNKKQRKEDVPVSVEKEEYEKMKEELQSLKENYSLLNDENRRLIQCEKNLQSEVESFRRSNRKECDNNKEALNLRTNYSLVSQENERLREREKMLEKEIENLKQQNCKVNEIKSNHVAITNLQQSNFSSMESVSVDSMEESVSSKPPGLSLIDLMGNVEENIAKVIKKKDSISGLEFDLSSSESEDEVEENNQEKHTISNNFLDDSFSISGSENEKEGGNIENGGDIIINNDGNQNAAETNSCENFPQLPIHSKDFKLSSNSEEEEKQKYNIESAGINCTQNGQRSSDSSTLPTPIPLVAQNLYSEKSISPKPSGLSLIDLMGNDEQTLENPHMVIQSKMDQDLIFGLNLSFSSSEDEETRQEKQGTHNNEFCKDYFSSSDSRNEKQEEGKEENNNDINFGIESAQNSQRSGCLSAIPITLPPMVEVTNIDFNIEEPVGLKSSGLDLINLMEIDEQNIGNPQLVIATIENQDLISGLGLSLSSSESENEDMGEGECHTDNNGSTGIDVLSTPSKEFKDLNLINKSEEEKAKEEQRINPDFFGIKGRQNGEDNNARSRSPTIPKKNEDFYLNSESEEDETIANNSKTFPNVNAENDKPKSKRSIFSPTTLHLKKKIKTRSILDFDDVDDELSPPPLRNQFNVAQKDVQEEYIKTLKIKLESVHEKLHKAIEDQKRNCAKIVRLDEEQNRWNLIKLDMVETQKKFSCMEEEFKILKEENRNLKLTLETVLATNEELGKLNHEMRSTKVNSEYLTVQQATALAEKVARNEVRKHVTRRKAIMNVKLQKERNKLVRIGFKRGRRARRIESEMGVPTVRVCEKVKEDDEVEENNKSVEAQRKPIVYGVDGMIIREGNEKLDGGKTNDLSFAEPNTEMKSFNELKNIEEMETANLKASERVKILDCHILKPAIIADFAVAETSTENALEAKPHDCFENVLISEIDDVNPSVDDCNGFESDDNQDQSFDDVDMPLKEKSPEKVIVMTQDAQIENHFCLSESDSDESLIIDEPYISDDAVVSHLIVEENLLEETKTKQNFSSSSDLGLLANSFKRKRSIDEINISRKMFALSPESRNITFEERNVDSSTSLTYKFVKPVSKLLLDTPTKINNSGLNSDTEKGIPLPTSSKVQILETQKNQVELQKSGKNVYLQAEHAVLMLFEIPSDSMINLLLQFETKILCKVIVKLSTEDFECQYTKQMNPIAPILSEYQIVLLRLLIAMTEKDETTKDTFLKIAETAILNIKSPIHLEPISRLHVAFMKYFYEFARAKAFILRSLIKMGDLAIPYLYFLGTSWPDVFVNYEATSGKDRLLAKIMMKLITFREIKDPEYFKRPLTSFLNQLYKYPLDLEPMDMLLKEIVKEYMLNQCDQLKNMILIIGANMSVLPFFKNILVGFKVIDVKSEEKVGVAVDLLNFLICNVSIADKMALQTIEDWISTLAQEDYSEKMKNTLLEITTQLNDLN